MKKLLLVCSAALCAVLASACCCGGVCSKAASAPAFDPAASSFALPAPAKDGGMSLMKALAERRTVREFQQGSMDTQTLSELLYAAYGVNRADGKRTIPTAMNTQDLEIFAVLPNAAYRYDAKANTLVKSADGDHRAEIVTRKDFGTNAACVLVYTADLSKYRDGNGERWSRVHVGSASQDVYLYCAAKNLATVSVGMYDDAAIRKLFHLNDKQVVILVQPVGFPAAESAK